jgi:hypothetical protein
VAVLYILFWGWVVMGTIFGAAYGFYVIASELWNVIVFTWERR